MIPRDYITEWRARAPWVVDAQVKQDGDLPCPGGYLHAPIAQ